MKDETVRMICDYAKEHDLPLKWLVPVSWIASRSMATEIKVMEMKESESEN